MDLKRKLDFGVLSCKFSLSLDAGEICLESLDVLDILKKLMRHSIGLLLLSSEAYLDVR